MAVAKISKARLSADERFVLSEFEAFQTDREAWYKYVKVQKRNGSVIAFVPTPQQRAIAAALDANALADILKIRRIGGSFMVAVENMRLMVAFGNFSCAVVAHKKAAARKIFSYYEFIYNNLPAWIRERVKIKVSNNGELRLTNGSFVEVATAGSDTLRGSGFMSLHLSEYAHYTDPDKNMPAILNTAAEDAMIIRETTANGLNHAYASWHAKDGYTKLFFSWRDDKRCRRLIPIAIHPHIKDLALKYGNFSRAAAWWATHTLLTRCFGDWRVFDQEFPLVAEVAFVSSGERALETSFPNVRLDEKGRQILVLQDGNFKAHKIDGLVVYEEPQPYHAYTCGVDTAGGTADGDFSSFAITDVTDRNAPRRAAMYYGRIRPKDFGRLVIDMAEKYTALLTIERTGGWGMTIVDMAIDEGYQYLYRTQAADKPVAALRDTVGWNNHETSRLMMFSRYIHYVDSGKMPVVDVREMCEINTLVMKTNRRIEAEKQKHDDAVVASALSLVGMDQADIVEVAIANERIPQTVAEIMAWEAAHPDEYFSDDERVETALDAWGMVARH